MKLHANAKLTPAARLLLCTRILEEGRSVGQAAEAAGVSERTARKWVGRYLTEGQEGLVDRSSRPRTISRRTDPATRQAVLALRGLWMTAAEIAECLGIAARTVSRLVSRAGLGHLRRLEPVEPANRFETPAAGELVHIDVKKLARIDGAGHRITGSRRGQKDGRVGYEYVHCAIDGATRLAYSEVLADERKDTVCAFLRRAVVFFDTNGIRIGRILTDNGSAYRSRLMAQTTTSLGIRHSRTRPYRPRTNGKVERFIQTLTNRWAYGAISATSAQRTAALPTWLRFYNHHRPHRSLGGQTPADRLAQLLPNNLMATHN
jgi:transposase InsO family protein